MPHKELLDPQGKAVQHGLSKMGLGAVDNVRIGKSILLSVDAPDNTSAEKIVTDACERLLVNKIMEQYTYTISALA